MEIIFGIYKKYWKKDPRQGGHTLSKGGGHALPTGPHDAPPTSTLTPYIHFRGEKNQREGFIAFYDTEAPPSPNLRREG